MFLRSEGEVTTLHERLLGWRVLVIFWELIREKISWTGMISCTSCTLVSLCTYVIDEDHLNAAGSYAESRVLDSLEFLDL